jgi:hypothetical protein
VPCRRAPLYTGFEKARVVVEEQKRKWLPLDGEKEGRVVVLTREERD